MLLIIYVYEGQKLSFETERSSFSDGSDEEPDFLAKTRPGIPLVQVAPNQSETAQSRHHQHDVAFALTTSPRTAKLQNNALIYTSSVATSSLVSSSKGDRIPLIILPSDVVDTSKSTNTSVPMAKNEELHGQRFKMKKTKTLRVNETRSSEIVDEDPLDSSCSSLMDYTVNDDGSCTCKICGDLVPSRTHWYRHKYKVHSSSLFQCEKCAIFFKSKKGYEGHVANRHGPKKSKEGRGKKDSQGLTKVLKEIHSKKEEEMVQKIIAQVKAECEAKGANAERRGYSKHY